MTGRSSKQMAEIPDLDIVPEGKGAAQEFLNALRSALRFISYRPRSTREVERKLSLRFGDEIIRKVTYWLLENKYLDDKRFAAQWKDYRDRLRPRSLRFIRRELKVLGVSEDILNDLLVDSDEGESAYNAVIRLARKKRDRGMDTDGISKVIYPYLRRRGFNESVIRGTTARIASELFSQRLDR